MSALPVAAAGLEALPRDAKGLAVLEITGQADRQEIDASEGVEVRWLVHPDPHEISAAQEDVLTSFNWPDGVVRTLIAGETATVSALRLLTRGERGVARERSYASGYWRIGLAEDAHQTVKAKQADEDERRLEPIPQP